jgi:hypothetical protein
MCCFCTHTIWDIVLTLPWLLLHCCWLLLPLLLPAVQAEDGAIELLMHP